MKLVTTNAYFHLEKCVGCKTCTLVCPTAAYVPSLQRPLEGKKVAPCSSGCPIERARQTTRDALARVDLSKIKERNSVNILASHCGFTLRGGAPCAEMLKVTRDVIEERPGIKETRPRAGVGSRFREAKLWQP